MLTRTALVALVSVGIGLTWVSPVLQAQSSIPNLEGTEWKTPDGRVTYSFQSGGKYQAGKTSGTWTQAENQLQFKYEYVTEGSARVGSAVGTTKWTTRASFQGTVRENRIEGTVVSRITELSTNSVQGSKTNTSTHNRTLVLVPVASATPRIAAQISNLGRGEGTAKDGKTFPQAEKGEGTFSFSFLQRDQGAIPTFSGEWKANREKDVTAENSSTDSQIWVFESEKYGKARGTIQGGAGEVSGWTVTAYGRSIKIKFGVQFSGDQMRLTSFREDIAPPKAP
jgi:hypothetical protein